MSLMFPEFFGGEGGVSTNRVVGKPFLGITFGPQIQVYYLIAVYTLHLHRADVRVHAHAARPHAQRRARQPRAGRVHRLQHAAGALPRLHHRRLLRRHRAAAWRRSTSRSSRAEVVSAVRSGAYLLFTFLGGATFFFGPIIGAVLMVLAFGAAVRADQGLAALPRPGLPVHGDVRAGRHRQPDHDEPARRRVRQARPAAGLATPALRVDGAARAGRRGRR